MNTVNPWYWSDLPQHGSMWKTFHESQNLFPSPGFSDTLRLCIILVFYSATKLLLRKIKVFWLWCSVPFLFCRFRVTVLTRISWFETRRRSSAAAGLGAQTSRVIREQHFFLSLSPPPGNKRLLSCTAVWRDSELTVLSSGGVRLAGWSLNGWSPHMNNMWPLNCRQSLTLLSMVEAPIWINWGIL